MDESAQTASNADMDRSVQTSLPAIKVEGSKMEPTESQVDLAFELLEKFPGKKLTSASEAEKRFQQAVLEASAELSHDFHAAYLEKYEKGDLGKEEGLEDERPSTFYETLKKGFLFYLNGSGKYLVLREHLREAVIGLLHHKSVVNHISGFRTREQYQNFLHDGYSYILDAMNEAIHSTAFTEGTRKAKRYSSIGKDIREARELRQLLIFAQEAFAQSDYENAQRLYAERVTRSDGSDQCWIDFGIMWLSRGDDRLAEIAVREALSRNPNNLVGLLIAGLIAGHHRDERGITCLEALLKHRPLCPEIHVLLATVHSHLGHHGAAAPLYEKARSLHHALTGGISKIPEEALDGSEKMHGHRRHTHKKESKAKIRHDSRRSTRHDRKSKMDHPDFHDLHKRKITKESKQADAETGSFAEEANHVSSIHFFDSSHTLPPPDLGFKITMSNILDTKPPTLNPCPIVTWNVTKKLREEKKHQEMDYKGSRDLTNEVSIGEIQKLLSQFNDVEIEKRVSCLKEMGVPKELHHHQHHHHHHHRHHKNHGTETHHPCPMLHGDHNNVDMEHSATHMEEIDGEGDRLNHPNKESLLENTLCKEAEHPLESEIKPIVKPEEKEAHSMRFGSELLWTAHLLLHLRQFEFLDVVLAKEISRTSHRSPEYLYLRAASLHLRGRNVEALTLIREALELDPKNGALWTLQGHAYYDLRENESALASYVRGLMLPHGRESLHLIHLRFGTLCNDNGDAQTAKRIFIKRVNVAPTPYLWIAIGTSCYNLGELENALNAFAEANKLDNKNPVIWGHLALVSLTQQKRNLAEQAYKWAIRFGLKNGKLMKDIKELHRKLGWGTAAFPRVPQCIPHDVFIQRLGRDIPMELYKEALNFHHLSWPKGKFDNSEAEEALIKNLRDKDAERRAEQTVVPTPSKSNVSIQPKRVNSLVKVTANSLKKKRRSKAKNETPGSSTAAVGKEKRGKRKNRV